MNEDEASSWHSICEGADFAGTGGGVTVVLCWWEL